MIKFNVRKQHKQKFWRSPPSIESDLHCLMQHLDVCFTKKSKTSCLHLIHVYMCTLFSFSSSMTNIYRVLILVNSEFKSATPNQWPHNINQSIQRCKDFQDYTYQHGHLDNWTYLTCPLLYLHTFKIEGGSTNDLCTFQKRVRFLKNFQSGLRSGSIPNLILSISIAL